MMMFDVKIPGPQRAARSNIVSWSQEVLISKGDLEEYIDRVRDLETKVKDTEEHCEYEIKYNNEQLAGKIKALEDRYEGLLDEARVKHQSLYMAKAEMELDAERKRIEIQAIHAQHMKDMEEAYCKKIMVEISRYDEVVQRKEAENARWTQQMETMSKAHELALQELMEAYEAKLEDTHEELQQSELTKDQIAVDSVEMRKLVEEEADLEIEEQREQYEEKLKKADEAVRHIMGENGVLKSKFITFQKEVDTSFAELNELVNQKKELYEIVNGCQRDIQMLRKDLESRDEILLEKDHRIYELKRANQELEKFKWVLDWKIKDLIRSIGPSQIEAAEVKDRMEAMEDELLSVHDKLKNKDILLASLKAKLHAAGVERKRILFDHSRQAKLYRDFQADFHVLSQKIESVRALKMGIMELYRNHVEGKFKLINPDKPLQEEQYHQREILERKVKTLEHVLRREREQGFRTHMRMVKDNQHLLGQTKELREEVRSWSQTPMSSAPGSRMSSRPSTSDSKELSSVRKQLAELQLELSAKNARVELLEEHIESAGSAGLRQCMGVKKMPLARR
ncbi:hypothetical protein M758_6G135600 [Ceratodon purpureus]|nr:hypothetical protein M758_6G135600 [Ceratodon purpureus]